VQIFVEFVLYYEAVFSAMKLLCHECLHVSTETCHPNAVNPD